ncbi:hypothetical protein Q3V23_34315 [Streptomyces sp. VNUA116]|uniref:hypothetical protein n=1 Tax=Streptomyces sp. VNUA116 TaxID=3062449 RepID=UPI0026764FB3|nr:hypothetical protein [Streptomyces sp. VNUA116]WKU48736.1 hypothetical protein Q3V23_34315 [Streptomyces sp. VNUA116]
MTADHGANPSAWPADPQRCGEEPALGQLLDPRGRDIPRATTVTVITSYGVVCWNTFRGVGEPPGSRSCAARSELFYLVCPKPLFRR